MRAGPGERELVLRDRLFAKAAFGNPDWREHGGMGGGLAEGEVDHRDRRDGEAGPTGQVSALPQCAAGRPAPTAPPGWARARVVMVGPGRAGCGAALTGQGGRREGGGMVAAMCRRLPARRRHVGDMAAT